MLKLIVFSGILCLASVNGDSEPCGESQLFASITKFVQCQQTAAELFCPKSPKLRRTISIDEAGKRIAQLSFQQHYCPLSPTVTTNKTASVFQLPCPACVTLWPQFWCDLAGECCKWINTSCTQVLGVGSTPKGR